MILMNDFKSEPAALRQAMQQASERVITSGWYILGNELKYFEKQWADTCGTDFSIGVGNGMDAIEIILRTLGIGQGDEVITTPMTAFATVETAVEAMKIGAQDYLMKPFDPEQMIAKTVQIYEEIEGWEGTTVGARSWADLPAQAIKYIRRIEELIDVGEVEAGSFSIETAIAARPDVAIVAEWQFAGLGDAVAKLESAGIPVVVADYNAQTVEKHVASTLLIGKIMGADLILDEITAHARAAVELHPGVDTILEIGGQDSKFTTLRDGLVTLSVMNNVCAAGTGSFLDQQAEKIAHAVGKAEFLHDLRKDRRFLFNDRECWLRPWPFDGDLLFRPGWCLGVRRLVGARSLVRLSLRVSHLAVDRLFVEIDIGFAGNGAAADVCLQ